MHEALEQGSLCFLHSAMLGSTGSLVALLLQDLCLSTDTVWGVREGGSYRVHVVGVVGGVLGSQLGGKHISLDVNLQLLWHLPRKGLPVDHQRRGPTLHVVMHHLLSCAGEQLS